MAEDVFQCKHSRNTTLSSVSCTHTKDVIDLGQGEIVVFQFKETIKSISGAEGVYRQYYFYGSNSSNRH